MLCPTPHWISTHFKISLVITVQPLQQRLCTLYSTIFTYYFIESGSAGSVIGDRIKRCLRRSPRRSGHRRTWSQFSISMVLSVQPIQERIFALVRICKGVGTADSSKLLTVALVIGGCVDKWVRERVCGRVHHGYGVGEQSFLLQSCYSVLGEVCNTDRELGRVQGSGEVGERGHWGGQGWDGSKSWTESGAKRKVVNSRSKRWAWSNGGWECGEKLQVGGLSGDG